MDPRGTWDAVSSIMKGDLKPVILSGPNSPSRNWNNFCARSVSLDRNEGNAFKEIEDEHKRNDKLRGRCEERRRKHDLEDEKREKLRSEIRQKYGIGPREDNSNAKKSDSYEGSKNSIGSEINVSNQKKDLTKGTKTVRKGYFTDWKLFQSNH